MSIPTLIFTAAVSIHSSHALWVPEKRAETEPTTSHKTHKATIKAAVEPEKTKTTHKPSSSIGFANAPTQHTTTLKQTQRRTTTAVESNPSDSARAIPSTFTSNPLPTSTLVQSSQPSTTQPSQTSTINQHHDNRPDFTQGASNTSSSNDTKSSSNGGLVGGVVAAAAIIVLAAGAFLVFRKKKKARYATQKQLKPDPFTMGYGSQDFPSPLNTSFPPASAYVAPDKPKASHLAAVNQDNGIQSPPVSATPSIMTTSTIPIIGKFVVIATYVPTLSDEIEIEPGDKVDLLVEYDDGWCQGINTTRGNIKGVFPRHCIDNISVSSNRGSVATSLERSKRISSMLT
ncbi:hypothetical protein EDC96DRAFT_565285 [Choanephora cucurbitarum]|nr:hypothetical protein EDC96DRAFT_565285 [Choanephora cucurbitarum]